MRKRRERKEETEALMENHFRVLVARLMLCFVSDEGSWMEISVPAVAGAADSLIDCGSGEYDGVASPFAGTEDFSPEVLLRIPRIDGSPIL